MPEKKSKKVFFSEEDAVTLTHRYDATTVLTLLQEVAHYPHSKFDWNELVKKTSTGISNAREYQMLWRHLAYHDALSENFEDGAEPLDDDSDLDCELEALPPVSAESASEAAACVKVMIASRTLSESTPSSSTIEAPLTISVPVGHSSRTSNESSQPSNLMRATSTIFPVTVQRQTLPTISSTDGVEAKGLVGGNMASKRKRKAWSEEEDMQLRAAVQRWGEGNWATMAKGDNFPINRSANQLAQRWTILRKKDGSANSGTISTTTQYTTAEHLATRHSLSLALDMPFKKLTAPGMTEPVRTAISIKNQVQSCNSIEASTVRSSSVPPQRPSQQSLLGSCGSLAKSKLASERSDSKCNPVADPELKSTTVDPGARDSPSNSASQLKVAQVRNIVNNVPAGSSLTKTSVSAGLLSDPTKDKHVTSIMVNEASLNQEVHPTKKFRVSDSGSTPNEKIQKDEGPIFTTQSQTDSNLDKGKLDIDQHKSTPLVKATRSEEISEHKAVSQTTGGCEEQGSVKNSNSKMETTENENSNLDKETKDLDQDKRTNSINGSCYNQNMNDKHVNLPIQGECSQGLELSR